MNLDLPVRLGERWRLIIDSAADGPTNMAIDETILEAVGRGDVPPTLRLYRWQSTCLSLGYAQPASDVDRTRLEARGWQIVRRLTGGRAILHTDEFTYSVALPIDHPLVAGTILDSYRRLSAALLSAVEAMGVTVQADRRKDRNAQTVGPVCFEVPSHYEITANGKKLVGSAQVRKHNAALQHGSLPLCGDVSRIVEVLAFADDESHQFAHERVLRRATTLSEALGQAVSWEQAAQGVIVAFERTFGVTLDESPLSRTERHCADELRVSRYAAEDWTRKR